MKYILGIVLTVLASTAQAQSTRTFPNYVTGLPAASAFTGSETLYAIQGGTSVKATASQLLIPSGTFTAGNVLVGGPGATQVQDSSALSSSPGYVNLPVGLNISTTLIGSVAKGFQVNETSETGTYSAQTSFNSINVTGDAIVQNSKFACAFCILHNYGYTTASGSRNSFYVLTNIVNGGTASGTVARFDGIGNTNLGGGAGTEVGNLFGINPSVQFGANATHWIGLIGAEIDVAANASATYLDAIGLQIVQTPPAVTAGSRSNIGMTLANALAAGTTPGWTCGYCFGAYSGFNPIASTGTLIGTFSHAGTVGGSMGATIANGIDFRGYTFSGFSFASPGFSVDGTGTIVSLGRRSINVTGEPYNAKGDGSTDDSTAINTAISAAVTAITAGTPTCVYFPRGHYVYSTAHATLTVPVCFTGDGGLNSVIQVATSLSGDVFSFSDTWFQSAQGTNSFTFSGSTAGVVIQGISVFGNRTTVNAQNAFSFYDRNDLIYMDDVYIGYMNGACVKTGYILNRADAYNRESYFGTVHCNRSGSASQAAWDINSAGTHDATDEITFANLDIYGSYGPSLWILNCNTNAALGQLRFQKLRIEGSANSAGHLVTIGDATCAGAINDIKFDQLEMTNPISGYSAFYMQAPNGTAGLTISNIVVSNGYISQGAGKGLNIQAGRGLRFTLANNGTTDTQFTVGATTLGIGAISINGYGGEYTWTTNIDATALGKIQYSVLNYAAVIPGLNSGWGTTPGAVTTTNGANAFTFTVGTAAAVSANFTGLPAATNGWYCTASDQTNPSGHLMRQIGYSTTTATIGTYNAAGTGTAPIVDDVIVAGCRPF